MSKKNRTKEYYLKRVQNILVEISHLSKDQDIRFKILKKKAQKYINRAKEIEGQEP